MKERPILFSSPMIRALLAGTKTQTRRIVKAPSEEPVEEWRTDDHGSWYGVALLTASGGLGVPVTDIIACPYGVPDDQLWVREAFYCDDYQYPKGPRDELLEAMEYRADHDCRNWEAGCPCADDSGRSSWRPSIHMPRWASRITLEIAEVRVQRLLDITEDDARAEGVEPFFTRFPAIGRDQRLTTGELARDAEHRASFAVLWDEINGDRQRREWLGVGDPDYTDDRPYRMVADESARWSANPWVWALTFKRVGVP
jgi:hypothetical protein